MADSEKYAEGISPKWASDEKNLALQTPVLVTSPDLDEAYEGQPTEEELKTLRKTHAPMPWPVIAMCLIEFAERASYYGSSGPFNNFINLPLPKGGNGAGAVAPGAAGLNQSAGALGRGSVTASALVKMFSFLSYLLPVWGGHLSDSKLGKWKAIWIGTIVGAVAHVILVIPAIPSVIDQPKASLGLFIVSIMILAFAAGFIKPSLGPLLCDQSPVKKPTIKVTKTGERVIIDPETTVAHYLLVFYGVINIGAMFSIATRYSARLVGFWLAYLLPGILYMMMPAVLLLASKRLVKLPPQGSILPDVARVIKTCLSNGGWKRIGRGGEKWWARAKPSYIQQRDGSVDTSKVYWDDKLVDEVQATFSACGVFALIPIFALADGGFGNTLNDQSTTMIKDGVPNDLMDNFNPLTIIVFTPIITYGLYPFLARIGYPLSPMWRMAIGFWLAALGCLSATLVQWKIYSTNPCGRFASSCVDEDKYSPLSLWLQIPSIAIPALGEVFVNVTSYEIAYTRSPPRMRALVYSLALFNSAIASAISMAVSKALADPNLIIPWAVLTAVSFVTGFLFPTYFKFLDKFDFKWTDDEIQATEEHNNQRHAGDFKLPADEEKF